MGTEKEILKHIFQFLSYEIVKLNNPLMGTEKNFSVEYMTAVFTNIVKLNNPLMGTENITSLFATIKLLSIYC